MTVLLAADQAVAQQAPKPDQPAAQSPAAKDDLVAWAEKIRPDIETIAGAKFKQPPTVKALGNDEMAQLLAKSIEADMAGAKRADGKEMSAFEIQVHATAAAYRIAKRTFGLYRYEDKTVYINPETAGLLGKKHAWGPETVERLPRLAIAHEFVHALQDQVSGLGERLSKTSGEERAALAAVTEGHAVWVTDQFAAKQGWDAADSVLWGLVTGVQEDEKTKAPQPTLRVAPPAELYKQGREFVRFQAEKAGAGQNAAERLWTIVAHPPTRMSEIRDPASFRGMAAPDPGVKPSAPGKP